MHTYRLVSQKTGPYEYAVGFEYADQQYQHFQE
jgi:hypothetical protein